MVVSERFEILISDRSYRSCSPENILQALKETNSIKCNLLPLFVPTVRGTPASVVDRAVIDHGKDSQPTTVSLRKSTSIRSVELVSALENSIVCFFRLGHPKQNRMGTSNSRF